MTDSKAVDPKVKNIIFDWGKTFHDFDLDVHFNWLSRVFGIPRHHFWHIFSQYPNGLIFPYERGLSTRRFIERFREESAKLCVGRKISVPSFSDEEFVERWNMIIDPSPPAKERVSLLRKLKGGGYGIYFLSNTNQAHAAHIRGDSRRGNRFSRFKEVINLADRFFGSSDTDIRCRKVKPSQATKPECEKIFRKVLAKIGALPGECVFIDDTQEYIAVFQGMGGRGIHCTGNWTKIEYELYHAGVRWD
ncbi:MAG: hypothetical protein A2934_01725 [Candidatus Sungbacteria bacterium RIFCSPLOWO2_01_FULL_47_10]|uniref:Haloacid dehalogenase n=1 Tax=Candidatus Sungbacteria bacterium RIFCSPLOWO2_01_FULL_47_10 TaxID=1802276 RepID=A0A1G2KYI2_9BACT|nr:MAG: hypothetical protein A2934_01725 [Candidatus Sungbacteria bacterium RIFCSPLOWO2_01_FULL_47_10]